MKLLCIIYIKYLLKAYAFEKMLHTFHNSMQLFPTKQKTFHSKVLSHLIEVNYLDDYSKRNIAVRKAVCQHFSIIPESTYYSSNNALIQDVINRNVSL